MFLCLMESQKVFDDVSFKNSDYALICGVSPDELLNMEYNFFKMLNFNTYIGDEEFKTYKEKFTNLYSQLY